MSQGQSANILQVDKPSELPTWHCPTPFRHFLRCIASTAPACAIFTADAASKVQAYVDTPSPATAACLSSVHAIGQTASYVQEQALMADVRPAFQELLSALLKVSC